MRLDGRVLAIHSQKQIEEYHHYELKKRDTKELMPVIIIIPGRTCPRNGDDSHTDWRIIVSVACDC